MAENFLKIHDAPEDTHEQKVPHAKSAYQHITYLTTVL